MPRPGRVQTGRAAGASGDGHAAFPVTALEMSGKNVPHGITGQSPTSTTLFSRRNASHETSDRAARTSAGRAAAISTTDNAITKTDEDGELHSEGQRAEGADRVRDSALHQNLAGSLGEAAKALGEW